MRDTKRSELISTQLRQIAEQAIEHPDRVFTTLIHRMDVDFLREAYYRYCQVDGKSVRLQA